MNRHDHMTLPGRPRIRLIYSESAPARGGIVWSRVRALGIGGLHLLFAASLFYAVWWPIDFWMTDILIWKTPVPRDFLTRLVSSADGESESIAQVLFSGEFDSPGDDASVTTVTRYVKSVRGPIMGLAVYGWEAVMAFVVCAWGLASGTLAGNAVSVRARRVAGWSALVAALTLGVWAAITWQRTKTGFPVNTGQIGVGGLAVLLLLVGGALGRRPRAASMFAAILTVLAAAISVYALTLGDRCEALDPPYNSMGFRIGVFLVLSAYGWLVLAVLLLRRSARKAGWVRL